MRKIMGKLEKYLKPNFFDKICDIKCEYKDCLCNSCSPKCERGCDYKLHSLIVVDCGGFGDWVTKVKKRRNPYNIRFGNSTFK